MTDRSHLTPVTTTDKRGRTTTVYRNLNGTTDPSTTLPTLPQASLPAAAPAPADLAERIMREPSERSVPELSAFLISAVALIVSGVALPDAQREQIEAILAHEDGRAGTALAMDYAEDGLLDPRLAFEALLWADAESPGGEPLDALRLTAFFQPRAAELDAQEGSWLEPWQQRVCRAVAGYRNSGEDYNRAAPAISTREQLDSCASVIDLVLRFDATLDPDILYRALNYTKVANPALEGYLREGPYDPERIGRIAGYVTEHGMDGYDPEAVHRMRGVLDGGTGPAIGNGWL